VPDIIKKNDEILDILRQACARRELLILATPYLRFESSFLAIQDGELHIQATMTREDATYGLRAPDLIMRFPDGLGFFEAKVSVLGLGVLEGRRTLKLSIPKALHENDQRSSYRVERVGRVLVTYSTLKGNLMQGSLVDISTTGAKVHAQRDLDPAMIAPDTPLLLSIPLSPDIQIEARAEVRHVGARSIGLVFRSALDSAVEQALSRWVFLRREEDRERLAQRLELNDRTAPARPQAPRGILLVSTDPALEVALGEFLTPIQPLVRLPLAAQSLKDALAAGPPLAIFHVNGTNLDERRRLKTLAELASGRVPVLILGTQVEGSALFDLVSDWKASSAMVWSPSRGLFLQRLAQGIIRRHTLGGDSPMAPKES
jgi:hypothetical protein